MSTYSAHPHPERSTRTGSWISLEGVSHKVADITTYWLVLAGIYITFGWSWYYAFYDKLIVGEGTMPLVLKRVFAGSFIETFPGLNAAWTWLGVMEGIAVLGFAISLFSGELLPNRRKPIMLMSLGWSMITYSAMIFANAMVGQTALVGSLFAYFIGTAVVILLVLLMPPYRPHHWLSSLFSPQEQ